VSVDVVDAGVAVKLYFPEAHSDRAISLFANASTPGRFLLAPPLFFAELTNVIRKRMRTDRLTLVQATAILDSFLRQPVRIAEPSRLHHIALRLAAAHSPGVYDAHYVALTQMLGYDLWVDDHRLLRASGWVARKSCFAAASSSGRK
jgi:predicted nucleic acid-binding protein